VTLNRRRPPIAPILAAAVVYLLVAGVCLVVAIRADAQLGSVTLLLATAAAWRFSRWYQRRYID
jgi:hypothetical protein